jgi:hypothetical protein
MSGDDSVLFCHVCFSLRMCPRTALVEILYRTTKGGPFSQASDPKADLHFWDPSDAFPRWAHRLERKTGSTFPHDALKSAAAVIAGAAAL